MVRNCLAVILIILILCSNAFSGEVNKSIDTRVLLIGIDGLEWSMIKDSIKDNKMPTFAKLMKKGVYGDLYTFLDYTSPSLWTTIATGRPPEVHGITRHILHEKGLYEPVYPGSRHRKVKALWNILTDYKEKTGVVNYQCTKPPEVINGAMVSSLTRKLNSHDLFPEDLTDELNFTIEKNFEDTGRSYSFVSYFNSHDNLSKEIANARDELVRLSIVTPYIYLRFGKNLNLQITYFYGLDNISHIFWKFMDPKSFQNKAWGLNSSSIKNYGSVVKDMYADVDKFVKTIMDDVADKNTVIVICSDHGFKKGTPAPRIVFGNLNKLLERIGVLYFKNDNQIDFSSSQAYHYELDEPHSFPNIFVSINLKGRQPYGIINPGRNYLELKKRLIDILSSLTIMETNAKLFDHVSESSLPEADIKVAIKYDINLTEQHVKIGKEVYPLTDFYKVLDKSGDHSDPGVIIIYGKNIKQNGLKKDAHILDITPTILYLLGLPVAEDMEGKVLTQAIDETFLKNNPVRYIPTYETKQAGMDKTYEKSSSQIIERKQLDKLKSLGYVQ